MVQPEEHSFASAMSDAGPAPKQWPPVDLIAGLSLETTAEAESQLDEKVHSGRVSPRLWIALDKSLPPSRWS